jgi:hypothetical protein
MEVSPCVSTTLLALFVRVIYSHDFIYAKFNVTLWIDMGMKLLAAKRR